MLFSATELLLLSLFPSNADKTDVEFFCRDEPDDEVLIWSMSLKNLDVEHKNKKNKKIVDKWNRLSPKNNLDVG